MNQKRVIVVSKAENAVSLAKSKSAQVNPLSQGFYSHSLNKYAPNADIKSGLLQGMERRQLAESNLVGEEDECMVNQAYYTYQDPDYDADRKSIKQEQTDQYVIESMFKKKEMLEKHKKNEEKHKFQEKQAKQATATFKQKRQSKHKQVQKRRLNRQNKSISSPQKMCTKMHYQKKLDNKCKKSTNQNWQIQNENLEVIKKQLNNQLLKPKPLDFDVDMLDKLTMKTGKNKKKQQLNTYLKFSFKAALDQAVIVTNCLEKDQSDLLTNGENRNCRKLPFRFNGVM